MNKFYPTKPVCTRREFDAAKKEGRHPISDARIICTDYDGNYLGFSIIAVLKQNNKTLPKLPNEFAIECNANGEYPDNDCLSLINLPETRKVWVNVYDGIMNGHNSKERADIEASFCRIACVETTITFTPGEGL